ncbi:MAG: hypothetical protein HY525_04275 [Betaproteobacteria bacterium]|nr:hypothetical protein [Betaproteobacteria bacterium]
MSTFSLFVGIDHGFSFPDSYFKRYGLKSWDEFLADFCRRWPTDRDHTYVDFVRDGMLERTHGWPPPDARVRDAKEFRLCERWTSSAKSVFQFDVQGAVAKSTHAGIPWLKRIRGSCGDAVHFWPFDGWSPPGGKTVAVGNQQYRVSACFANAQHQRRPRLGTRPGNTVSREPAPCNVADLWRLEPAGGGLRHQNRLDLTFMRPRGCSRSMAFFCSAVSGPSSGSYRGRVWRANLASATWMT